jgi:hypothetical protein
VGAAMKFSIRDLFLVTVIVAMGLGWGLDRSRLAGQLAAWKETAEVLTDFVKELGYTVRFSNDGKWSRIEK